MSYSDDLDWLARNVHEWKEGKIECIPMSPYKVESVVWSSMRPCEGWITKDQWLARRAELQNKPNWADAPEWAEWLAQDSYGCWGWFQQRPTTQSLSWFSRSGYYSINSPGHLVIGDWRDTLEQRPDMHKSHEEIDTSAERVQKTPESVRNWHESGELPPVGVFVDVTGDVAYGEGEKCCEVIAHVEDCAVIRMSWGLGCFVSRALSPHRTERDELVDIIASNGFLGRDGEACYLIADAIISAGFERNGGKS